MKSINLGDFRVSAKIKLPKNPTKLNIDVKFYINFKKQFQKTISKINFNCHSHFDFIVIATESAIFAD